MKSSKRKLIVLALAVGIFRLMLPRLPEYQEELKAWASTAIGMQVEFSGMNARWRFSGPELNFFNAELLRPGATESLLSAQEVSIGVGLLRLLVDREVVVDRVLIRDAAIDLRQDQNGKWLLQGVPVDDVFGGREVATPGNGAFEVVGHVRRTVPGGEGFVVSAGSSAFRTDSEQFCVAPG